MFFPEINPVLANSLQTSLAVAILFALVLIVRKPFARSFGAKSAYALWLLPVARLFMPPLPANISLFGFLAPQAQSPSLQTGMEDHFFIHASPAPATPNVEAIPAAPSVMDVTAATTSTAAEPGLLASLVSALPGLILPAWLLGMALMLGLAWHRQAVFHRLIRDDSSKASDALCETTHEIAATLNVRRPFEVRTSLLNGSPLVTGLFRPVILLPEWFEADYSPREQRDALTHELMHVKRGDLFALQAAQIVLALQWFNPLAYMAIRAFRVDQEAACDADVLRAGTSSAFSYGRTLVKAARLAGPADTAFSGANLTLAHPIKERLILMQNATPTLRRRLLGTTLAMTLGSAAVFATASCAASAAPKDTPASELAGGEETDSDRKARVYRFSSHPDGEGHQFVLLSDPFERLHPRLEKVHKLDLSDLEEEMSVLSLELSEIGKFDLSSLAALGELGELGELEGLAELGNLNLDFDLQFDGMDIETVETDEGVKIIIPNQEIFISKLDGEAFEVRMEKIAAVAEAQAEKAERYALVVEKRMEGKAERMEEIGAQIEARVEAAFEGGLEQDLEAAGLVVETLAKQCEARDESLTAPVILSVEASDGETYRALCVNGEGSRLAASEVKTFIADHPELTAAEKERFSSQQSFEYEYSFSED